LSPGRPCVFCEIVAGREPARIRYVDDEFIVIVNRLTWAPVMLLAMPKAHIGQVALWSSGGMLERLGRIAVDLGCMFCPNGFRIVSNFGYDGLQTQSHAHIHILGGAFLGHYTDRA